MDKELLSDSLQELKKRQESFSNHTLFLDEERCESVTEKYLWQYFCKDSCFMPHIQVGNQYPITTIAGNFRIDFVISGKYHKIGIECDSKAFHVPIRDFYRDALILGEKALDSIYRIQAKDILYSISDVLFLLALLEPKIFTLQAQEQFRTELEAFFYETITKRGVYPEYWEEWLQKNYITERNFLEKFIYIFSTYAFVFYPQKDDSEPKVALCKIKKFFLEENMSNFYTFASQYKGRSLETLIRMFHGYENEALVTKDEIQSIINILSTMYSKYKETLNIDGWYERCRFLSKEQVVDGTKEVLKILNYMPSLNQFLKTCYASKKDKDENKRDRELSMNRFLGQR
jgi:hypothetical protein